jgi:hypothetical protein
VTFRQAFESQVDIERLIMATEKDEKAKDDKTKKAADKDKSPAAMRLRAEQYVKDPQGPMKDELTKEREEAEKKQKEAAEKAAKQPAPVPGTWTATPAK